SGVRFPSGLQSASLLVATRFVSGRAGVGVRLPTECRTTRLSSTLGSYLQGIETIVAAAPDSLLGLLQRGRGQGYINALAAGRASAEAAIVECVTHDPRIAHQVESRDEYYGRCAIELDAVVRLHTGYPP